MTDIRGLQVTEAGTYVLMADVVQAIREYAQSLDDANAGALIHDLATWLDGWLPQAQDELNDAVIEQEIYGAEADDVTEGVARVEIYPDNPDDPRPRWHARTVDTGGYVLKTTSGSFDQDWVIQNAQERFPGVEVYVLRHAGEDSKWIEDSKRGVFPSMGPPVRRLWAGVSTYERAEQGGIHKVEA
jgi:hypothetical protein